MDVVRVNSTSIISAGLGSIGSADVGPIEAGELSKALDHAPSVVSESPVRTRSGKELLAWTIRTRKLGPLVGQRTEGAVLGAGFFELPDGRVLELAILDVPVDGVRLEGVGVPPHVEVDLVVPYAQGRDSIFEKGCEVAVRLARRAAAVGPF